MVDARLRHLERDAQASPTPETRYRLRLHQARAGALTEKEARQLLVDQLSYPFLARHLVTPCCKTPVAWQSSPLNIPTRIIWYWHCPTCNTLLGKIHGDRDECFHDLGMLGLHDERTPTLRLRQTLDITPERTTHRRVLDHEHGPTILPTRLLASLLAWHHRNWPGDLVHLDWIQVRGLAFFLCCETAESLGEEQTLQVLEWISSEPVF